MKTEMVTHTQARERTSRSPPRSSRRIVERAAGSPRARGRTRSRNPALTRKVAESTANAHPAPGPATRAVASAGPRNCAAFAVVWLSALAAWMSSSGTVWGTSAV